jgi:RNA polymerase sigma-70 factor (ECF subfamily)
VFVTAYKTIHNWPKPLQDHVAKKYLFIIARSRMIDFWKKASNRYEVKNFEIMDQYGEEIDFFSNVQDDNPLPEELFEQNENKKLALKMLEILSPNDREIIILKYIEDLPYNEISEILKTSEEVVRKRVSRALQKVKESLKN